MLFKVSNTSKTGFKTVPTIRGRTSIGPEQEKTMDLEPNVARMYRAMATRGKGHTIKVSAVSAEGRAELDKPIERERSSMPPGTPRRDVFKPIDDALTQERVNDPYEDHSGETGESESGQSQGEGGQQSQTSAKAELLSRADTMEISQLRAEAKMLLGKDWPQRGDSFNQAQIKKLLKD